ncbi:MAG: hypothetical protein GWO17_08545 [Gemmatimonadetes bacterium]|nr:hypothetical protein [Gemmatimonadota bacterium]
MAMGSDLLDPGGLAPAAGISIGLRPAIDPLEPGALDGDTTSPGYRSFRQRCGGCHVAPSPSGKRPSEWPSVVRRMGSYVEEAGLLPVGDEERAAILEFLDRHGRPRR